MIYEIGFYFSPHWGAYGFFVKDYNSVIKYPVHFEEHISSLLNDRILLISSLRTFFYSIKHDEKLPEFLRKDVNLFYEAAEFIYKSKHLPVLIFYNSRLKKFTQWIKTNYYN